MIRKLSVAVVVMVLATAPLLADLVGVFTLGDDPNAVNTRNATVEFWNLGGNRLQVIVTNTANWDLTSPSTAWLITGVMFNIEGQTGALTPFSAMVLDGNSIFYAGNCYDPALCGGSGPLLAPLNVGGEFAYGYGSFFGGTENVVASSGFGGYTGQANFNGDPVAPPPQDETHDGIVDGADFGITNAGDDETTFNGSLTNDPLIHNQVVLVLEGYEGGAISDVWVNYGTDLNPYSVPEPSTVVLVLMGGGLILLRRRWGG